MWRMQGGRAVLHWMCAVSCSMSSEYLRTCTRSVEQSCSFGLVCWATWKTHQRASIGEDEPPPAPLPCVFLALHVVFLRVPGFTRCESNQIFPLSHNLRRSCDNGKILVFSHRFTCLQTHARDWTSVRLALFLGIISRCQSGRSPP